MHESYTVKFEPTGFIEHFGGITGSVAALRSVGVDVKPKTLQKQRERGNITSDLIASFMLASARMGKPINPYKCLLERADKG